MSSSERGSSDIIRIIRDEPGTYVISSRTKRINEVHIDLAYSPWHGIIGTDVPDFSGDPVRRRRIILAEEEKALSFLLVSEDNSGAGLSVYPCNMTALSTQYDTLLLCAIQSLITLFLVVVENPSPIQILPVNSINFTTIEFLDICKNEEVSIELPDTWVSRPLSWEDGNTSVPSRIIDEEGVHTASINTECGDQYFTADVRQGLGEVEIDFPGVSCSIADLELFSSVDYSITSWQLEVGDEVIEEGEQLPFEFASNPFRSGDLISLTVMDELGCTYSSSIEAGFSTCFGFPTAFSLDGNGVNDFFGPLSELEISGTLLIFDNWGNQVFAHKVSTLDVSTHWNGSFRGEPLNPGVYVYKFEVTDPQDLNGRFVKGDVTLIR